MKRRGLGCPRLVIADGHLGIWAALRNVYPEAQEQRCWNHRIVNVLTKIPKRAHQSALLLLLQIPYAESRQEAERLKGCFQQWSRKNGFTQAADLLDRDWERMGDLLQLSQETMAAPENHQSGGVTLLGPAAENRCGSSV